jgi:L-lactate dehydrogenase (cytochrome)
MAIDRSLQLAPASAADFRELARQRLPRQLFDYIDGAAGDEATQAANVADLARVLLRQRVLRDVSGVSTACTLFGEALALPLLLAPVGLGGAFAPRAEVLAARAAQAAGIRFCESTVSICSIEEVRQATQAPFWFQLYVMRDRGFARELMQRAFAAGCNTLLLTVDMPVVGLRRRDTRNGVGAQLPPAARLRRLLDIVSHPRWVWQTALGGRPLLFGNLADAVPGARNPNDFRDWVDAQFDPSVTWRDIDWVRANFPGRVVLKGILDADDAREAVAAGADGIVVSNHGGRQLDGVPSTASVLPTIAAAVERRIPVLFDGGIRGGVDLVRALALGADACLVGRPWAWAVAGRGEAGVTQVIQSLQREMQVAMALAGVAGVAQLGREQVAACPW